MNIIFDYVVLAILVWIIFGESVGILISKLGTSMKFRIIQRHNGDEFYYQVEQQWLWMFWKRPEDRYLNSVFLSCKKADEAIDRFVLQKTMNDVILERYVNV